MEYIKIKFGRNLDESGSGDTFDDMFRSMKPLFTLSDRSWNPPIDIYETPEEIIIRAEIAGVDKDDLGVEINTKAVRIYGKRQELQRQRNSTYRLAEIQYGKFERILYLPSAIDTEVVSSVYSQGFLEIRLVKQQQEQPYRIPISEA